MSQKSHDCMACLRRRTVLAAGVGGIGAVLAGCASYGDEPVAPRQTVESAGAAGATSAPADGNTAGAAPLAAVADIPVGGGIILADQGIVLTQPTEGTVVAFSATCTHAGCAVTSVSDGQIRCPCHGSTFDVATGEPTGGPAGKPLPGVAVTVSGPDVVLA